MQTELSTHLIIPPYILRYLTCIYFAVPVGFQAPSVVCMMVRRRSQTFVTGYGFLKLRNKLKVDLKINHLYTNELIQ